MKFKLLWIKHWKKIAFLWAIIGFVLGTFLRQRYMNEANSHWYTYPQITEGRIVTVIIAVLIADLLIIYICKYIKMMLEGNVSVRNTILFGLPVAIALVAYFLTNVGLIGRPIENYFASDEKYLWDSAVSAWPWWFVYTSGLWLVCIYIVPCYFAPIIIKIAFVSITCGYIVFRLYEKYKSNIVFLQYVIFALPPFLEMGICVHRMPWYSVLYVFVMVLVFFESYKDVSEFSKKHFLFLSILISFLTIWRREGFYFVGIGFLLCIFLYKGMNHKRRIQLFFCFLFVEVIVSSPALIHENKWHFADKWKTIDAIAIHMLAENSFDRNICANELVVINKVIDIDRVDRFNNELSPKVIWGGGNWAGKIWGGLIITYIEIIFQ